jgi:SnoaL-like domain
MKRARFNDYIRRFNLEDPTVFDEFLTPDMKMLNGALEFTGSSGMRDHYENKIWPHFVEVLEVMQFVGSDTHVAVQLVTSFTAKHDADTLFGHVVKGERFQFRGLIMYTLRDGWFSSITVAYNSFTNTKLTGEVINMGLPH